MTLSRLCLRGRGMRTLFYHQIWQTVVQVRGMENVKPTILRSCEGKKKKGSLRDWNGEKETLAFVGVGVLFDSVKSGMKLRE